MEGRDFQQENGMKLNTFYLYTEILIWIRPFHDSHFKIKIPKLLHSLWIPRQLHSYGFSIISSLMTRHKMSQELSTKEEQIEASLPISTRLSCKSSYSLIRLQ